MAFTDGFYILRGLRPGTYTVKASYISYGVGVQTVTVGPGEVQRIVLPGDHQVVASKPGFVAMTRTLALDHFRLARERSPGEPLFRAGLARALVERGQYAQAHDEATAAVRLDPGNGPLHRLLADVLDGLGRDTKARESRRRANHLDSPQPTSQPARDD